MRSTEAEWQDFVFKIYALLMKRIDLRCLSFQLFNTYHIPKNMDLNFYNNSKVIYGISLSKYKKGNKSFYFYFLANL